MTIYSYSLAIDDSQKLALEAAVKLMIDHCEEKLSEGAGAPFWAHKQSCGKILEKLRHAETTAIMTSSYDGGKITIY